MGVSRKNSIGEKNLARGKGFTKGVSGNPAGRPPSKDVSLIFREYLLGEHEYKDAKGKKNSRVRLEMIMQRLFKDAMAGKTSSIDILLERGLGKAKATIAHEGLSDLAGLDVDQRRRILQTAVEELKIGAAPVDGTKRPAK